MARTEVLRAYRFALAPTAAQEQDLRRSAGAARFAFNYSLGLKVEAHQKWRAEVDALVETGIAKDVARKQIKAEIPNKPKVQKAFQEVRGDATKDEDGIAPWWREVSTYCFQSAFIDADTAWSNWLSSLTGKRKGRLVGYPRFKKKGRSRDSFRIHHDVKKPTIRLATYRRLTIPRLGEIRLHDSGKKLGRLIARGHAVIQSVTVSRGGDRWYASVLCKVQMDLPDKPTRRQAAAGRVGVDLGVNHLMVLSRPVDVGNGPTHFIDNPRHLRAVSERLKAAQRALSRTEKGSQRREKAKRRVARLHNQVAERRAGALHQITKRLTTGFREVAIEDLAVAKMTRSAKGTVENPGRNVRQKSGLNRSLSDASFGEIRRQIGYKASWYGSKVALVDQWFPSSKTCSACGWRNPSLALADRVFTCESCGLTIDRDLNAARNIEAHAVSPDSG